MLLGLLAGSTLSRGSPLKSIGMTLIGLTLGIVGTDVETGLPRCTFGIPNLLDGIELVALANRANIDTMIARMDTRLQADVSASA